MAFSKKTNNERKKKKVFDGEHIYQVNQFVFCWSEKPGDQLNPT